MLVKNVFDPRYGETTFKKDDYDLALPFIREYRYSISKDYYFFRSRFCVYGTWSPDKEPNLFCTSTSIGGAKEIIRLLTDLICIYTDGFIYYKKDDYWYWVIEDTVYKTTNFSLLDKVCRLKTCFREFLGELNA